jgi:multicomponent Na+:H+ antiporter subunit D
MALLVLLPILISLLTAIFCLLTWHYPFVQRCLSVAGSVALLASGLGLLAVSYTGGIQVAELGSWPAPFGIVLVGDLLSAIMVAVTGVIAVAVSIYSLYGLDDSRQEFGFYPLLHILLLGVCGAFLTGDMFNLYVWFEVMLIASFVLVALGGEREQLEGAIKYVTLNLLSSALFLAAAGVLYSTVGTLNMADLAAQLASAQHTDVPTVAAAILLVAFGIKAAVFPLFFWLPASYHTPPAVISAVMAGLLTKVGVYALVRVFTLLFAYDFTYVQPLLIFVAAMTMITGVLGAAAQNEFRRILSFHIISQIGYMIMGLAICTPLALAGTVFYLVHHILVKTNLFLIAGIVQRIRGSSELSKLGGLYRERVGLAALFLIPALSLAGLPPLSGFWAKLTLVLAGLEAGHYALIVTALVVSLLTLYSMTKIWAEAFWKRPSVPPSQPTGTTAALEGWPLRWMVVPSVALSLLTVSIGLAAEPLLLLATVTAEQLLDPSAYIEAVLRGV